MVKLHRNTCGEGETESVCPIANNGGWALLGERGGGWYDLAAVGGVVGVN